MINLGKNKKYFLLFFVLLFLVFIWLKSRAGIIFFGDFDISLWTDNKYLANPYLWIDNDYGYYMPVLTISLPLQMIFRILVLFFDINFMSNLYYYGSILGIILSSIYLLKKVNKKPKFIDYAIISFFAIGNPLIAAHLLGEVDIVYSLIFATFFIGYLFNLRGKEVLEVKDVIMLNFLILLTNFYILITVLILVVLSAYVVFFHLKFINRNKMRTALAALLFFSFNLFWTITPLYVALNGVSPMKSIGYSSNTANEVMAAGSNLARAFSVASLTPQYITDMAQPYSFFTNPYIILPLFSIIVFAFYGSVVCKKGSGYKNRKIVLFLFFIFVFFSFLTLGANSPFKNGFLFLWNNIPGFNLFRATIKFQLVTYFAMIILLAYSLNNFNNKKIKIIILLSSTSLLLFYFSNNFYNFYTRQYKIPQYYSEMKQELAGKKLVNNFKIFPDEYFGSKWAYTSFDWNANNTDSSNVLLYYTKKNLTFIPPGNVYNVDNNIDKQLCNVEFDTSRNIDNLTRNLSLLNTKHIIMQNDIRYKDSSCFNPIGGYEKKSIGKLDLYTIDNNNFLPHFYTPQNIITSKRTIDELPRILSQDDYHIRSAIYFENQNMGKEEILNKLSSSESDALPTLEFRKIDPTKYQVRVHGASGIFPLVFSESFHDGWKAYLEKIQNPKTNIQNLDRYKILDGNEEDQASKDELVGYIKNRWISTLGNDKSGAIDYISKNFQGTIQNDNLPGGNIFETWFEKPIDNNKNHLMANGYANSWAIDTNDLCGHSDLCVKNADGTYDFEMVVEFWPQRLFYAGLAVSVATFISCLGYLGFNFYRRKKS